MLAVAAPIVTAAADNSVPLLIGLGGLLLGGGGAAGVLTALAQRKNYVQSGYKDLTEANRQEAADERARADDERARRERAEYQRDRWRAYAYALRDEQAAAGVISKAIPPVDHPSEGP